VCEGRCVSVQDPTDFIHVCEAVVVFGAKGEFLEGVEGGDPNGVEVEASVIVRWEEGRDTSVSE
jgi:hypothetical protein